MNIWIGTAVGFVVGLIVGGIYSRNRARVRIPTGAGAPVNDPPMNPGPQG